MSLDMLGAVDAGVEEKLRQLHALPGWKMLAAEQAARLDRAISDPQKMYARLAALPVTDQSKLLRAWHDELHEYAVIGVAPTPTLAAVRGGLATISKGMSGDPVTYVQALAGVSADGSFGDKTEAAVKAFQTMHDLPPTGVVDQATMAQLDMLAGGTSDASSLAKVQTTSGSTAVARPEIVAEAKKVNAAVAAAADAKAAASTPVEKQAAQQAAVAAQAQADALEKKATAPAEKAVASEVKAVAQQTAAATTQAAAEVASAKTDLVKKDIDKAEGNWLVQHSLISALPNWGVVAGGTGLLAALWLLLKGVFVKKVGV